MGEVHREFRGTESSRCAGRLATVVAFLVAMLLAASAIARATETIELDIDGVLRTTLVHVPANTALDDRLPLVLVFHGSALNGRLMEEITGFSELADREGFIVVYPNGSGPQGVLSWNAGSCCSFALEREVDDLGFIDSLLDHLIASYPVDLARIYATGFSNGGMLTHVLGIERTTRFAAIAVVSGAMFPSQTPPGDPLPVMIIHGTADAVIPYVGGWGALRTLSGKTEPAVAAADAAGFWIGNNGCDESSAETTVERNAQARRTPACSGGAEVVLVTLLEGGHAWPTIAANPDAFLVSDDAVDLISSTGEEIPWDLFEVGIDASRTVWEFFRNHVRP